MKLGWTKGLDKDAAKEVTMSFNAAGVLRERLQTILEEKNATSTKGTRKSSAYDCPNWAYKQADAVGYQRAIDEVISLLSSTEVN